MKSREKRAIPQERDRHLDVPAEANRDKHINFLKVEEQEGHNERPGPDSPLPTRPNTPRQDENPEGGHRA
jgi:hypothetical protein